MRVVLFAQSLTNRAGIERMTVELACLLSGGYDVSIIVIEPYSFDKLPYFIEDKINIISLNSNFSKFNIKNILSLRKHLRNIRPSVLITVATPLVRITAPAIIGLDIKNIGWEHFNLYAGSKVGSIWKLISTYLVATTVVLTDADAENFNRRKAHNVIVIPNFSTISENKPSCCSSKVLLAVGRHAPQKGFDLLIKAWSKVNVEDWKLVIVGGGELKEKHEALAESLGVRESIIFKDSTPNIVDEYQNASCFILSSRFEGLVMVLIEAKMMGLPCISYNCPTGPQEIIRDNVDGWLVENGNVDAMAKTICKVLSLDNIGKYGALARQDAISRYGVDMALSKWDAVINS